MRRHLLSFPTSRVRIPLPSTSTFATVAAAEPRPRPSAKRARRRKSKPATASERADERADERDAEQTDTREAHPSSPWQGLSAYRLQVLRRRTRHVFPDCTALRNENLDALLITSSRQYPLHLLRPLIHHTASLAPKAYTPSHDALVKLVDAVVEAAAVAHLPYSPADISTEAVLRLTHAFGQRPSIPLLDAVVRYAVTDPVVERRSRRAWAVVRTMRSQQLVPTPAFLFRCFQACVAALDVPSAVTFMDHALSSRLYSDHAQHTADDAPCESPSLIDYYNGVMYAAAVLQQTIVVHSARDELVRKRISMNSDSYAALLISYLDTGDNQRAEQARASIEGPLPPPVHAAYIRAAAREKDASRIDHEYRAFEKAIEQSGREWHNTLSQPAVTKLPPYGAMSDITLATARADPTMSAFYAFRACNVPDHAVALSKRLKRTYGYCASRIVNMTIIEAAWRAGKLEMAQKLRAAM